MQTRCHGGYNEVVVRNAILNGCKMAQEFQKGLETDERFPTGPWVGFWVQRGAFQGRQRMDLSLAFQNGRVRGDGQDVVGPFVVRGRYDLSTGKVVLHKEYLGAHEVLYEGWAEPAKGIWGVWRIMTEAKDGFHMWPKAMRNPTGEALEEQAPAPLAKKPVLVDV